MGGEEKRCTFVVVVFLYLVTSKIVPQFLSSFFKKKYSLAYTYFKVLYKFLLHGKVNQLLVVVQSLSRAQHFETPRTTAHQAPLSSATSQSLLEFMSIKLVMLFNHLIL